MTAPDLPTGAVTFLFTDVEGSVRLWETAPSEMRVALARHDALVEKQVTAHGGALVRPRGEGDSRFAVFTRASDAVGAALYLQLALAAERWPTPAPLRVRVALNTGEADLWEGDYYGPAVNRCARLRGTARGGQVLVSAAAEELVRDALPDGATLRDLGERRLRDLSRLERVYQLCHPDLPSDFSTPGTLESYQNNLPPQLTSFVGREREVSEVRRLIGTTRLLTLTGTGGCGKTRLAYQVAAGILDGQPDEYPDGVWAVELAALSDPDLVARAVASSLGLREASGQPIEETLVAHLKPRQLLLLLDNCEHLLEACAELAERLLLACPHLRILATSREILGVSGEAAWRVPSLKSPDPHQLLTPERLAEYEAITLFLERARLVQPAFQLTERNASAVAEICSRLDGIPLAIELAAARTRGLTVEQISGRIGDRFGLLTGGRRTALRRQQTLRATIDWSHDLLTAPEKALFRRLAVFAGGFTLEAAEAVGLGGSGDGGRIDQADVLDLLMRLVDRSLVVPDEVAGEARYHLLETIRQYAQEKLLDSGETIEARDNHVAWGLDLARRAVPEVLGPDSWAWLDRLEVEHDNLRAALSWCLERDVEAGLEIVGCLFWFWDYHCHFQEGSRWASEFLARCPEETLMRARALRTAGAMARGEGLWTRGAELFEESVRLCRLAGDKRELGISLCLLANTIGNRGLDARSEELFGEAIEVSREVGNVYAVSDALWGLAAPAYWRGDRDRARWLLEESLGMAREIGHLHGVAYRLVDLGLLELPNGDRAGARALLEEGLALFRSERHVYGVGQALLFLGYLNFFEGQLDEARALLRESMICFQKIGTGDLAQCLELSAELEMRSGTYEKVARLLGAIDADSRRGDTLFRPYLQDAYDATLAASRSALGEQAFARAWEEGQAMSLYQAVEYALRDPEGSGGT